MVDVGCRLRPETVETAYIQTDHSELVIALCDVQSVVD